MANKEPTALTPVPKPPASKVRIVAGHVVWQTKSPGMRKPTQTLQLSLRCLSTPLGSSPNLVKCDGPPITAVRVPGHSLHQQVSGGFRAVISLRPLPVFGRLPPVAANSPQRPVSAPHRAGDIRVILRVFSHQQQGTRVGFSTESTVGKHRQVHCIGRWSSTSSERPA
jgi:hypothetical protein